MSRRGSASRSSTQDDEDDKRCLCWNCGTTLDQTNFDTCQQFGTLVTAVHPHAKGNDDKPLKQIKYRCPLNKNAGSVGAECLLRADRLARDKESASLQDEPVVAIQQPEGQPEGGGGDDAAAERATRTKEMCRDIFGSDSENEDESDHEDEYKALADSSRLQAMAGSQDPNHFHEGQEQDDSTGEVRSNDFSEDSERTRRSGVESG